MNICATVTTLLCIACLSAKSQELRSGWENTDDFITHNRTIEKMEEDEKVVIRLSEAEGAGVAWLRDVEFFEGAIQFDARGRDLMQRSFIGIAFHGNGNDNYETVYFRPFNFHSSDPVRRSHAVQYAYEPDFGFDALRKNGREEFESAIKTSNIGASDWFHVKVEVRQGRIKVFVNDSVSPCLDVKTLNPTATGRKVGLWVGNNSNGDFAHLRIAK